MHHFPANKRVLFFLGIAAAVLSFLSAADGGDFDVYLDAAAKLNAGANIYAPPFIRKLQYYYSVFFALLLAPFSFNFFLTEFVWLLLSFFFLYRSWKLVLEYFDAGTLSARQYRVWTLLILALSLQFILYNVSMVQLTMFLLWAVLESVRLIKNGRSLAGGALLGLAINIKIMPVLILPYLFYRGYFKGLATALACFVLLLYLPSLFIGHGYNMFLLAQWWLVINPDNAEHLFETGLGMHSLAALLPVYLMPTAGDLPYPRNVLHLHPGDVGLIVNLSRFFLLGLSLLFLKWPPFRPEKNALKSFWELSYFILLIPLLLPHQQKYAFLLALPMVAYILYFYIKTFQLEKTAAYRLVFVFFALGMLLYSPLYGSSAIGWFLYKWTQHYRFLSFSTLLLIPVALYCSPARLAALNARSGG